MQPQLQRVEVQAAIRGDHDLAVDDAAGRQPFEQCLVQLRKIAIERLQIAALDVDVVVRAKDDRRNPSHLGSNSRPPVAGMASTSLASIGSMGGSTMKPQIDSPVASSQ